MALNLLKHVESRKDLFAVEKITLIYNLLAPTLVLFIFQRMDHPLRMLWDRTVITAMTFLLIYLYWLTPYKSSAFVRITIQVSLLSYWYPGALEFSRVFPSLDYLFATAEQWMLGGQPAIWFCHVFPQMQVSGPSNIGYFVYYPMILVVTLFYFTYRFDLFEKVSFVLVTRFFIYYLIYIFVPVAGPQFYFPAIGMDSVSQDVFPAIGDYLSHSQELLPDPGYQHGSFYSLVGDSQQVRERLTTAFPSSYVGVSTILMIMAWRDNEKPFVYLLPFYLLPYGATVYIRAYYLTDVIAGFISAFTLYAPMTKMLKK